jgi:hypothetical protein
VIKLAPALSLDAGLQKPIGSDRKPALLGMAFDQLLSPQQSAAS